MKASLLVNFGGPRNIEEISPFLVALLNDEEVIWPKRPFVLHHLFFTYIAKKRAKKVMKDYQKIGNKSPIFEETEALSQTLEAILNQPVLTFHRYLTSTHFETIKKLQNPAFDEITVFPLFPQFSYATTGSSARFFLNHLNETTLKKLRWIKSYPINTVFITIWQKIIVEFLTKKGILEKDVFFIFSAHGLPEKFVEKGDPYQTECEQTFAMVMKGFPQTKGILSYQSQFGREKWIDPATKTICETILSKSEGRKTILFIPISFTSDHIETLFEIEELYIPIVQSHGLNAFRIPAPFYHPDFPQLFPSLQHNQTYPTHSLLRKTSPISSPSPSPRANPDFY